jgi:DNA-binding CsgD family transcriptional regulator
MRDQDRTAGTGGAVDGATDGAVIDFLRVLNVAADGSAVAQALAYGLLAPWSPDELAIYVIDEDGRALQLAASLAYTPEQLDHYSHVPLTVRAPVTEVFRTGEELSWGLVDATEDFPVVRGWVAEQSMSRGTEVLGLPVRSVGRTVGVLLLTFPDGVERTWWLRSRLDAAVSGLGLWLRASHAVSSGPIRGRAGRGVHLTDRQRRLLGLLGDGATNAQIAAHLGVSVGTVKADLAHLFRVFGVSSRAELPVAARSAGLLTP